MTDEKKDFVEAVKEKIIQDTILEIPIRFPKSVYSKLKQYSKEKANDCFWLAIERLIDNELRFGYDETKFKMLMDRDEFIIGKVLELEEEINNLKKQKVETTEKPKETIKDKIKNKGHFGKEVE